MALRSRLTATMSGAADATALNPGLVRALLSEDPVVAGAELSRATLLLPASAGGRGSQAVARSGRTADGRMLLWAFTDLEALAAWDRHPAEQAVAVEGPALSSSTAVIAVNAAGPGAFLVDAQAITGISNGHAPPAVPTIAAELVDPDGRHPVRARANEAHNLGRRAAVAGRLEEACAQFERAIESCSRLGDRLHGAAAGLELASATARADSTEPALSMWERAAEVLAAFGEGDLAIGALLDAAEAALAVGSSVDAERLSVRALELCGGAEVADRLVGIWGELGSLR